jgi:DNA mismatch repair protein MutS2
MHPGALRALEFDRIVAVVRGLSVTPTGQERLAELHPSIDPAAIARAQRATSEGTRFLGDRPGFPLRAPADLDAVLRALAVESRALEPLRLLSLADYLESIDQTRSLVARLGEPFPILRQLVAPLVSFGAEIADVRRKIDSAGEVVDDASPTLGGIRERLRKQRAKLRSTLDGFLRGRETAKYLQEQVITDRNGRYVLVVRAEHRSSIPGIVHGTSASGASLFLEPLGTVEVNNEIVALEEQELEEVRRILLELTDTFRARPDDLQQAIDVATELDVIQARARFSIMIGGIEPVIAQDGALELKGARHPLLMQRVQERLNSELGTGDSGVWTGDSGSGGRTSSAESETQRPEIQRPGAPVPVDLRLLSPITTLVITGPNTGGKTVALKTAGLLVAMAQAGLHVPAEEGSRLPVFRSLFADIGDAQSISASLSTFSAHISHVVSMDRELALPSLVLLDEIGAGTDPIEGSALGIAVIDHFRARGAHLIATTHYDSLKSYASTTPGVTGASFGFDPGTFAPTYRIVYGSPGRSLAIEIAARLGMPASVIAAARENLSEPEKQLAAHLKRIDDDLRQVEQDRQGLARERAAVTEAAMKLRSREDSVREREDKLRRRLDAKLDDRLRDARVEIDAVVEGLKAKAAALSDQAAVRLRTGERLRAAGLNTGETGAVRAEARAALDEIANRLKGGSAPEPTAILEHQGSVESGTRVIVGGLGLEGIVTEVQGEHADVDLRGKRLRVALKELRVVGGPAPAAKVSVSVDLQPREGVLSELNVIGATVEEALSRLERFLDASMSSDLRELRIVHGHGTGQLRRAVAAFLKNHPLVERFDPAPQNQGGGGATVVVLKD